MQVRLREQGILREPGNLREPDILREPEVLLLQPEEPWAKNGRENKSRPSAGQRQR